MVATVIGAPRRHWLIVAGVPLCAIVVGAIIIAANHRSALGWALVVIPGACASFAGWQFYDARPRVVIDDHGILDRTLAIGTIPWDDIEGAHLKWLHGHPHLCLDLRDSAKYTARLPTPLRPVVALNRQLGLTDLTVNLDGAQPSPEHVATMIKGRIGGRPR
jgi:hypothetical protein